MLDFHKQNTIVTKEEFPRNIPKKCVQSFENSQQFCHGCIYGLYSQHNMSFSPLKF